MVTLLKDLSVEILFEISEYLDYISLKNLTESGFGYKITKCNFVKIISYPELKINYELPAEYIIEFNGLLHITTIRKLSIHFLGLKFSIDLCLDRIIDSFPNLTNLYLENGYLVDLEKLNKIPTNIYFTFKLFVENTNLNLLSVIENKLYFIKKHKSLLIFNRKIHFHYVKRNSLKIYNKDKTIFKRIDNIENYKLKSNIYSKRILNYCNFLK